MLYAQQDQPQLAGDYLQRAVSLRPDYPDALNNLGVLFVREQRYPEAEEQFKTCIRVAPNFDQGYLNLARLYVLLNDKEKAREVLHALLRLRPSAQGGPAGVGDATMTGRIGTPAGFPGMVIGVSFQQPPMAAARRSGLRRILAWSCSFLLSGGVCGSTAEYARQNHAHPIQPKASSAVSRSREFASARPAG